MMHGNGNLDRQAAKIVNAFYDKPKVIQLNATEPTGLPTNVTYTAPQTSTDPILAVSKVPDAPNAGPATAVGDPK